MIIGILIFSILIIVFLILAAAGVFSRDNSSGGYETPERRVGRLGEQFATKVISEVLNEGDTLFTNVRIYADGKESELDNVIVNSYGVFIVEVKTYSGVIHGSEDDYKWLQTKYTSGGNFYQKSVKNPIKQVNRQVYILSRLFKENDIKVWIEGYAFMTERNAPFRHVRILENQYAIDRAIHPNNGQKLNKGTRTRIEEILRQLKYQ